MAVCNFQGNSDMYGLGIRLGYYLQWYGVIFAAWMAPGEPVETYIILLLMFGAYLALVPIYLWRLCTRCDPFWDPTRFPIVNQGAVAANFSFLLLIAVLVYQYWFWFGRVPVLDRGNCQQYGFLFGRVRLNSKVSVVINILLYVFLGLVCLYLLVLKVRYMLGFPDPIETRRKRVISRRRKYEHIQLLRNMEGLGKLIVAATVTAATELTIQWNEIEDVNTLASAGQTIPFVIGLFAVLRILYVYFFHSVEEYSDSDSEYTYRPTSRPPSILGGGGSGPLPDSQLPNMAFGQPLPDRELPHLRMSGPPISRPASSYSRR